LALRAYPRGWVAIGVLAGEDLLDAWGVSWLWVGGGLRPGVGLQTGLSPRPGGGRACAPRAANAPRCSRTRHSSRKLTSIRPPSRNTAAVQSPVASRSTPLIAGDSTAPISPIRFIIPNAAPSSAAFGTRSAASACQIGCSALKNRLETNSSTPSAQTALPPAFRYRPNAI